MKTDEKQNDYQTFLKMWKAADSTVTEITVKLYYKVLESYALAEIGSAIKAHLSDSVEGRFKIKPAHIIGILNSAKKQMMEREFYRPINMNRPQGTRGSYEKRDHEMKKIRNIISEMNLKTRKGK